MGLFTLTSRALFVIMSHFLLGSAILLGFRHYLSGELFEQILLSGLLSALLLITGFNILRRSNVFFSSNDSMIVILALLLFWFAVPNTLVNIDRSRSFYVLSWANEGEIRIGENSSIILNVKSSEAINYLAVVDRITEQENRGLLVRTSTDIKLSTRGVVLVHLSDWLAKLFLLDGWSKNKL